MKGAGRMSLLNRMHLAVMAGLFNFAVPLPMVGRGRPYIGPHPSRYRRRPNKPRSSLPMAKAMRQYEKRYGNNGGAAKGALP